MDNNEGTLQGCINCKYFTRSNSDKQLTFQQRECELTKKNLSFVETHESHPSWCPSISIQKKGETK